MTAFPTLCQDPAHEIAFEFDPRKAALNLRKHRVSFTEAMTVFYDLLSSTLVDDQHSDEEQRFLTISMSQRKRLLFVAYTEITSGIRIIGARLATATERQQYEQVL